ncbi:hypothetical protein DPMN_106181 [Dreissena polymorpha]|uniref:Uncharacterized protein n=1 Tax=Dreissena polymorpha TaxID=45954 RepID=A0A9D4K4I9_DREPO|nr:hypothetical protein DPMN_106181 [Dreissena polymorpha]
MANAEISTDLHPCEGFKRSQICIPVRASRGLRSASLRGLQEAPDLHPCEGFKRSQICITVRASRGPRSASLRGLKKVPDLHP